MRGQKVQENKPSLDAATALCDHIKKQGFPCRLFSDITVVFHGKEYCLHKIILSQSHYFNALLSGPWRENGSNHIELRIDDPMVTPEGFESAISFMYGLTPTFTTENLVSIHAAAGFLGLQNLCENSIQFVLKDLKVDTFSHYNRLSEQHCDRRFRRCVRTACWCFLCSHASRELRHQLPELSLEILWHLLKSDDLWVPNEAERYKLAKQALIDWRLARTELTREREGGVFEERTLRKRRKSLGLQTSAGSGQVPRTSRSRSGRRNLDLKRLRRLWESDPGQQFDGKGGFELCSEIFTDGGIIFAHLKVNDILKVKRELEDANVSSDAASDSLWHHVLLKNRISKLKNSPGNLLPDNDEDFKDDNYMQDDDEDFGELYTSDSADSCSTDSGDDASNSIDGRDRECSTSKESLKVPNSSLGLVSSSDVKSGENLEAGKRKTTTGGFTWLTKPHNNMRLVDFPPCRFSVEFVMKDGVWTPCLDSNSREVFYGGIRWYMQVFTRAAEILLLLWADERGVYRSTHKEVGYHAKLSVKTMLGLVHARIVGVISAHTRRTVSVLLARDVLREDESLRISCVVQLIDAPEDAGVNF